MLLFKEKFSRGHCKRSLTTQPATLVTVECLSRDIYTLLLRRQAFRLSSLWLQKENRFLPGEWPRTFGRLCRNCVRVQGQGVDYLTQCLLLAHLSQTLRDLNYGGHFAKGRGRVATAIGAKQAFQADWPRRNQAGTILKTNAFGTGSEHVSLSPLSL